MVATKKLAIPVFHSSSPFQHSSPVNGYTREMRSSVIVSIYSSMYLIQCMHASISSSHYIDLTRIWVHNSTYLITNA